MKASARAWSPVSLAPSRARVRIACWCLHADNILLFAFEAAAGPSFARVWGAVVLCLVVVVSAHDDEQRRWSIGGVGERRCGSVSRCSRRAAGVDAVGRVLRRASGLQYACCAPMWGRYYRLFTFQGALLSTGLSFAGSVLVVRG